MNSYINRDSKRYFTKSAFKLAMECPTKLFYISKENYANQKKEDSFLEALAEGGFQVGALAKCYYPGGHEINSLNHEEALIETNKLLRQENVIIFEAAIRFKNSFIRTDILVKKGNCLELIEVKAKVFDDKNPDKSFLTKKNTIRSGWKSYIEDVAFQKYILSNAFPDFQVKAFLMLVDKNTRCPTDNLHQKFKISIDDNKHKTVKISENLSDKDLSEQIIFKQNVDECCEQIYKNEFVYNDIKMKFNELIDFFEDYYLRDEKIISPICSNCGKCEFRTVVVVVVEKQFKSGYHECLTSHLGWKRKDFNDPLIFDVWDLRIKDKLIEQNKIKMISLTAEDIDIKKDEKPGCSRTERQWLQISKVKNNDKNIWIDKENLAREMSTWTYPLHFIDFETSKVAISFNKGRYPYEDIAFQFSHHIVYENGLIEHKGQYLNTKKGCFPNYDFIRALKKELENDQGSIFRYAAHENTILNAIYKQLIKDENYIEDREDLCSFIKSITEQTEKNKRIWEGKRNMIDLLALIKRYYYDPLSNGSNSIKKILPGILIQSSYLQEKYLKPIYGAEKNGIKSHNFKDWRWIQFENKEIIDPYSLLPKMFDDISKQELDAFNETLSLEVNDGGDAMAAYAKMQYEDISQDESEGLQKALLKYCELDTFAMVMIYEGWKDFLIR
jgi:hypothetical protein